MANGENEQALRYRGKAKKPTCSVAPLTPITDPIVQQFEDGDNIDTEHLNARTKAGLTCMKDRVSELGGEFHLESAYRPITYQAHLLEVWKAWDKFRALAKKGDRRPECVDLETHVKEEFSRHNLLPTQPPARANPAAPHPNGNAIDANITKLPAGETVDTVADFCDMKRPLKGNDPIHYQPK
jgi:hypothetical protein